MRLAELRKATGLPAQTTLRGHLASLSELGVLAKRPTQQMPYAVEHELTPMGQELLDVAGRLDVWLGRSPDGPISLESGAAKGAIRALVDGWGSTMMRRARGRAALADRARQRDPRAQLPGARAPPLEHADRRPGRAAADRRRRARLHGDRLGPPGSPRWPPPATASWSTWDRRGAPVTEVDIEAAFLLAAPLVGLPERVAGSCQLEVEPSPGVDAEAGRRPGHDRGAAGSSPASRAWSRGRAPTPPAPAVNWFNAVASGEVGELRFGGSRQIAEDVVGGLHATLRRPDRRRRSCGAGSGRDGLGRAALLGPRRLFADEGDEQLVGEFRQQPRQRRRCGRGRPPRRPGRGRRRPRARPPAAGPARRSSRPSSSSLVKRWKSVLEALARDRADRGELDDMTLAAAGRRRTSRASPPTDLRTRSAQGPGSS